MNRYRSICNGKSVVLLLLLGVSSMASADTVTVSIVDGQAVPIYVSFTTLNQAPTSTAYCPENYPSKCGNPNATCATGTPNCTNGVSAPISTRCLIRLKTPISRTRFVLKAVCRSLFFQDRDGPQAASAFPRTL